ncbi:hypothetical protein ACN27F_06950 [Solwaraspora sp. WMMB335]|uniref:hypothetical protein n=1 Tax=Solwaraspora sp. WMMB335 TaxID=3404118 RepID=UPI003B96016D
MNYAPHLAEPHLAAVMSTGLALAGEMLALAARQVRTELGATDLDAPLSAEEDALIARRADELVAAWLGSLTGACADAA